MKILVTYQSKTGFTKKYAEWISHALGADLKEIASVSNAEVKEYDLVIHGGWIMGGMISGLEKIRKMNPGRMIVFGVGLTAKEEAGIPAYIETNKLGNTPFFYYEGGTDPKKMGFIGRTIVKLVTKRTLDYCDHTDQNAISELINMVRIAQTSDTDVAKIIAFRLEANVNTYAAYKNGTASTRFDSHDFTYSNGSYTYYDTYVGGEKFAGEEAIWHNGKAQYAMNYIGRVLGQQYSGDFLKEALRHADANMPYRGPEYYQSGEYSYKCNVVGDFSWFQGSEEIYCSNQKVYECYFHGGLIS